MDINLKNFDRSILTIEDVEKIQELDMYHFSNRVYNAYKGFTKGNEDVTYQEARKKIIRNIMLSYEAPMKDDLEYKSVYYYGNLAIHCNEHEKSIAYIKNCEGSYGFRMNKEKRKALNYILAIEG